jgi:C4-dicarboxylate transporter, DctM subunit
MLGAAFLLLFGALALGTPIFVALGATVMAALGFHTDVPLEVVPQRMWAGIDSFTLMAIPFFLLSAELMRVGGLSERLIALARALVGFLPGGLAMSGVLACMFFACISGSSPATVAAVGGIMIPGLVKSGYSLRFATGLFTVAGSLGILIPPSITFIIYGAVTGASIGALFLAGVIPGLVIGGLLMGYCAMHSIRAKIPRDPMPSARQFLTALRESVWCLGLPVVILGGIYGGIFTATEAAAVSVVYAFFVGYFVYGQIRLRDLGPILRNTGLTTAALLLVIAGASAFSWLLASQEVPQKLAATMLSLSHERWVVLLLFNVILLIAGCFLESASAVVIFMPLMLPIAQQVGIDPIHLGVIFVVNMEIGMVTPPVGLNLMVAKMITNQSFSAVTRSVLPFMVVMLVGLVLVTYVPALSTLLPSLLSR